MSCKKCHDQLAFFLSGSAHDYYGLLGIMSLGVVGMILFLFLWPFWLLMMIFAAGVFVDLWAHEFKH
jgi:hypothetical protein